MERALLYNQKLHCCAIASAIPLNVLDRTAGERLSAVQLGAAERLLSSMTVGIKYGRPFNHNNVCLL